MANEIPHLNKLRNVSSRLKDIGNRLDSLHQSSKAWADAAERSFTRVERKLEDIGNSVEKVSKKMKGGNTAFDRLKTASDKVGKSLVALNASIIGLGINGLISGIQRVYELKERWTRATGMLNMRIGALTPNIKNIIRESRAWEGTMRGLTDQFGEGSEMFAEFADTLETTGKHVQKFSKLSLVLARGFNLGGRGAGELTKSFRSMGVGASDASVMIASMTKNSELLGVNSQQVVRDLAESGDLMARFGKEGAKSLIQSAVFLKQFNIGLKDTRALMDTFDRFDSAAETTARLNTIFGTTISSLDMLLSKDPAERIEKVRQGLLAQGKTFDQMSYFERRSLTESLNLSERELSFLLDQSKAHISLAEFREKASKQQINEQKAQKMMHHQLQKTAQTLFAFGAATDRITLAIAKAIRPLLEMLGLVKSSDKEWKSFGQVMSNITDHIVHFFESLSKSKEWMNMMKSLAGWIKKAASATSDFMMSGGFTDFIDKAVGGIKTFVKISGILIAIWTGSKVIGMIHNMAKMASMLGGPGKLMGAPGRAVGKGGRILGKVMKHGGRALGAAGMGLAAGSLIGGGSTGGNIGGLAGGMIGTLIGGPLVGALGSAVGAWLGDNVPKLINSVDRGAATGKGLFASRRDQLLKERAESLSRINILEKQKAVIDMEISHKRNAESVMIDRLLDKDGKRVRLSEKELVEMRKLVKDMNALGIETKFTDRVLRSMNKTGSLTKGQLSRLKTASENYHGEIDKLAKSTARLAGLTEKRNQLESMQNDVKLQEQMYEVSKGKAELELRRMGREDLANIAGKDGWAAAADKVNNELYGAAEKLKRSKETLEMMQKGEIISGPKLLKNQKAQVARLEEQVKKYNKLSIVTGKVANVEDKLLVLKNKEFNILEKKLQFDILENQMRMMSGEKLKLISQSGGVTGVAGLITAGMGAAFNFSDDEKRVILQLAAVSQSLDKMGSARMASGGIVSRPTFGLIGEAGPEAVIPLKAIASGRGRQPTKFGGSEAKKLVNFAANRGSSSQQGNVVHVVSGDVYLDSAKVGRHIVRDMISNGSV